MMMMMMMMVIMIMKKMMMTKDECASNLSYFVHFNNVHYIVYRPKNFLGDKEHLFCCGTANSCLTI